MGNKNPLLLAKKCIKEKKFSFIMLSAFGSLKTLMFNCNSLELYIYIYINLKNKKFTSYYMNCFYQKKYLGKKCVARSSWRIGMCFGSILYAANTIYYLEFLKGE